MTIKIKFIIYQTSLNGINKHDPLYYYEMKLWMLLGPREGLDAAISEEFHIMSIAGM